MSESSSSSKKSLHDESDESLSGSDKDLSDDGSIVGERLRGDGQEQDISSKKVDDDEDRRNPQYIPKRGNFYEHDDRTAENEEENEKVESTDKEKDVARLKKKVWEEKVGEKWEHDLYIEKEQTPKTKQELINAYGYDIRNEDGPPRARRRRRYGRGPNKYTRNWADEEAYIRQTQLAANRRRKPKNKEEFPPLNPEVQTSPVEKTDTVWNNKNIEPTVQNVQVVHPTRQGVSGNMKNNNKKKEFPPLEHDQEERRPEKSQRKAQRSYSGNELATNKKPERTNLKEYHNQPRDDTQHHLNKQLKPNRQNKTEQRPKKNRDRNIREHPLINNGQVEREDNVPNTPISSQSFSNSNRTRTSLHGNQTNVSQGHLHQNQVQADNMYDLNREMINLKVTDSSNQSLQQQSSGGYNRQGSVPPRLQNEQQRGGPKRYSSLRQRSLPETTAPPFGAQQHVNPNYYQQEEQFTEYAQPTDPMLSLGHSATTTLPQHLIPATINGGAQIMNRSSTMLSQPSQTMSQPAGQMMPGSPSGPSLMTQSQAQTILTQAQPMQMHTHSHVQPQVSHPQMLAGQPLPPMLASQPGMAMPPPNQPQAPPQMMTTGTQGPQAILNPQQQQLISAQGHPQYPPPPTQYQVQAQTAAAAVYNIPQGVAPPQPAYIPQSHQQPTVISYATAGPGPQAAAYQPTPYQTYTQPYNTQPGQPTQELYQPQGGITYYSPHSQQSVPRPPLKRPKAAIPILAPPEHNTSAPTTTNDTNSGNISRGRGRLSPTTAAMIKMSSSDSQNSVDQTYRESLEKELSSEATHVEGEKFVDAEELVDNTQNDNNSTNIAVSNQNVSSTENIELTESNVTQTIEEKTVDKTESSAETT